MEVTRDEAVLIIKNLIETCKDGREGFKTAAGNVNNPELTELFLEYSVQREHFINELTKELVTFGADAAGTDSTIMGKLHRGWMDIKSALRSGSDLALLEECEKGEEATVKNYRETMEKNLTPSLKAVISKQYNSVQESHNRIRSLKSAAKKNP